MKREDVGPTGRKIVELLHVQKRRSRITVTGELSGFIFKEGNAWIAYCRSLDLASCGKTPDGALAAVKEAIGLWFDSCTERGTLEQAPAELGWACQDAKGEIADCREHKLPPAFMIDAMKRNGKEWSQPIRFSG